MTEIRLEHVSYAYGQDRILEDINLKVTSGEVVSILGPSGVGKTTLFNLIAGILEVQSGRIVLDGEENPKGRVSYMLQKDLLLEHKTVLGNIILPLLIQKVDKAEAIARADEILATFQLTAVRDKYPHELSGGMRQRVALLRTYLFGHKLFLLDEAFSALDEMTKMELHAWYLEIHKQLQLTTLIITHSIEEALNLSDRIYILKNRPGQIVSEIKLEHVSYAYGPERILEDINLQVTSGEVVSILGPSGVGKTTLFNLIAGILEVQSGRIVLDGEENPKGRVSYMLQKDLLLEHKTVLGNIILPLLIQKVDKAEAIARADEILATFQLTAVRDKYPHELSGGMRQRVALLRTYLFGHKLFLLDEAFSALDEMTKMELHAWYLEIHKQLQLTTLIITHSIEEALNLSDRIYILKNRPGQIVSEIKLDWSEDEDKEVQKIAYKRQILAELGLDK